MARLALCLAGLALLAASAAHAAVKKENEVLMYWSEAGNVLDIDWDFAPAFLAAHLATLSVGAVIRSAEGQPRFAESAAKAYVIPVQNGPASYAAVEDLAALAAFVRRGGLVVVLDSGVGGSHATSEIVAGALGYKGAWEQCEMVSLDARSKTDGTLAKATSSSFLSDSTLAFPAAVEGVPGVQAHTLCKHEDPDAASWPLYTIGTDAVVAQAFGKAGVDGAVVWLSYSWKSGPQPAWGELLRKVIVDFTQGLYQPPVDRLHLPHQVDLGHISDIIQSVLGANGAVLPQLEQEVQRPQAQPEGVPDHTARERLLVALAPNYSPSPSPEPSPSPSPSPEPSPSPSPRKLRKRPPPPPPAPWDFQPNITYVFDLGAQGAIGPNLANTSNSSVVWLVDPDFNTLASAGSPLQALDRPNPNRCTSCAQCGRAWRQRIEPRTEVKFVDLYYSSPVMIERLSILQVSSPGVLEVLLLPWPAVDFLNFTANTTAPLSLFSQAADNTICEEWLDLLVPANMSGIDVNVTAADLVGFSPSNLPPLIAPYVFGGVRIVVAPAPSTARNPKAFISYIDSVVMTGRLAYPSSVDLQVVLEQDYSQPMPGHVFNPINV